MVICDTVQCSIMVWTQRNIYLSILCNETSGQGGGLKEWHGIKYNGAYKNGNEFMLLCIYR